MQGDEDSDEDDFVSDKNDSEGIQVVDETWKDSTIIPTLKMS